MISRKFETPASLISSTAVAYLLGRNLIRQSQWSCIIVINGNCRKYDGVKKISAD